MLRTPTLCLPQHVMNKHAGTERWSCIWNHFLLPKFSLPNTGNTSSWSQIWVLAAQQQATLNLGETDLHVVFFSGSGRLGASTLWQLQASFINQNVHAHWRWQSKAREKSPKTLLLHLDDSHCQPPKAQIHNGTGAPHFQCQQKRMTDEGRSMS